MRRARRNMPGAITRGWLGLLLASALWLCTPSHGRAERAAGRRVLLIEQGRDPFLERVAAELEKLGFSLVRSDDRGPLEGAARAAQAVAALRVLPARNGVEVWMADATSGRSLLRQVIVDESPRGPDHDLIALQTAELLRTSLLGDKAAPDEQPPRATRATNALRNTQLQLACGALYSPGGAKAALELGLSVQHFWAEWRGFGLDLGAPLRPGAITGAEGSAKLGAYFVGAALLARLQRRASAFYASGGAGAALLVVKYAGDAREPLRSSSGSQPTGAAYLRADAGVEAASWLRFGVRALAGASFQDIAVSFAGNEAGSFGPAFFAGFALADFSLAGR
jgi:hypothetical protein